jgi:integral membrane sensor domain MASE1
MMSISPAVTHLMAWQCQPSLKKPLKITEWLLLLLINIGLLVVIFVIQIHTFIRPLPYIFFPLIMYMGFRCNRLGWALTVSSVTYMCSWASIRGRGSLYTTLGRPSPASSHLILEVSAISQKKAFLCRTLWVPDFSPTYCLILECFLLTIK